jgi:hypothetical protein
MRIFLASRPTFLLPLLDCIFHQYAKPNPQEAKVMLLILPYYYLVFVHPTSRGADAVSHFALYLDPACSSTADQIAKHPLRHDPHGRHPSATDAD